jgi:hypothetical protein
MTGGVRYALMWCTGAGVAGGNPPAMMGYRVSMISLVMAGGNPPAFTPCPIEHVQHETPCCTVHCLIMFWPGCAQHLTTNSCIMDVGSQCTAMGEHARDTSTMRYPGQCAANGVLCGVNGMVAPPTGLVGGETSHSWVFLHGAP